MLIMYFNSKASLTIKEMILFRLMQYEKYSLMQNASMKKKKTWVLWRQLNNAIMEKGEQCVLWESPGGVQVGRFSE